MVTMLIFHRHASMQGCVLSEIVSYKVVSMLHVRVVMTNAMPAPTIYALSLEI
jgi:hypothetical protein